MTDVFHFPRTRSQTAQDPSIPDEEEKKPKKGGANLRSNGPVEVIPGVWNLVVWWFATPKNL